MNFTYPTSKECRRELNLPLTFALKPNFSSKVCAWLQFCDIHACTDNFKFCLTNVIENQIVITILVATDF